MDLNKSSLKIWIVCESFSKRQWSVRLIWLITFTVEASRCGMQLYADNSIIQESTDWKSQDS